MSGNVINRADLGLPQSQYDIAVVGAGMLGLATAFFIKQMQPKKSVIILEQGGVPSEDGASFVSPSIASSMFVDDVVVAKATWTIASLKNLSKLTGVTRPNDMPFRQVGIIRFLGHGNNQSISIQNYLDDLQPEEREGLKHLINLASFEAIEVDNRGGYGSAEAVANYLGHGAIKLSVDLMLNTRTSLDENGTLKLARLEYNSLMQRVVVKEEKLSANTLIVATGANTAKFIEDAYGVLLPYKKAYRQYPRIEADKRLPLANGYVNLPVIQARGFSLRPQGEGLLIVPPPLLPDPTGYEPTGGKLMGVRVGLRRELLETLLEHSETIPALVSESLNLGKTVQKIRGAWDVVTENGQPEWNKIEGENCYALVGGEQAFSLGLATAYDLAATLAGDKNRPWL